jgi:archaellum component FlaC
MLLKKIHRLKKKIKSHIENIDLFDFIVEDNNEIRKEINELNKKICEKDNEINVLHKRFSALEKLNFAYSKDILLLSEAVAEQYELLAAFVNKEMLMYPDDLFDLEHDEKKKKKKIVH